MTKFTYTEDLERRFSNAAKNGSKVCAAILDAIKMPNNVKDTVKLNYLTTVRINRGSDNGHQHRGVKITCCKKDFSNDNNPEKGSPVGMWRRENRSDIALQDLVTCFKNLNLGDFTDADFQYAAEVLIFDEPIKVVKKKGMANIQKIYDYTNYAPIGGYDDTLWSSCMRGSETAAIAGDFYANFCGASIIAAVGTISGSIYGRAIYWPSITIGDTTGAFLDRVYYVADPVRVMIWKFAEEDGAVFRKYENSFSSKTKFVKFSDPSNRIVANVTLAVPSVKWHKQGCPYMDTFSFLRYDKVNGFVLANNCDEQYVAQLDHTGGAARRALKICPVCGRVHSRDGELCSDCSRTYLKNTPVGLIYTGRVNKKGEPILPKKFVEASTHLRKVCGCI